MEALVASSTAREGTPALDQAEVVVVIVNYNAGDLLLDAVHALERQTFRNFQVIVVDNASTDGSILALRANAPQIQIIEAGRNLGFAAANNLAVRGAPAARWIALLNPDAFPEPDWLAELMRAALEHPDCASIASRTLDARNPSVLDGAGDAYHMSGRHWRRGYGCGAAGRFGAVEEVFSASGAAALYARAAWEEVGGFDERFFCYAEDVDLGFRLRLAGYRCLYVPTAVARHFGSAISGHRSDFAVYYGQRNLVWAFVKNMPGPLFWLLLPYHVALNLGALATLASRGQGSVGLRAKRDALRALGEIWRERRRAQAARKAPLRTIWRALEKGLSLPRY